MDDEKNETKIDARLSENSDKIGRYRHFTVSGNFGHEVSKSHVRKGRSVKFLGHRIHRVNALAKQRQIRSWNLGRDLGLSLLKCLWFITCLLAHMTPRAEIGRKGRSKWTIVHAIYFVYLPSVTHELHLSNLQKMGLL